MEEKSYHIRTNDPDVISKIENFNALQLGKILFLPQ